VPPRDASPVATASLPKLFSIVWHGTERNNRNKTHARLRGNTADYWLRLIALAEGDGSLVREHRADRARHRREQARQEARVEAAPARLVVVVVVRFRAGSSGLLLLVHCYSSSSSSSSYYYYYYYYYAYYASSSSSYYYYYYYYY
jgi:hypothetical protein